MATIAIVVFSRGRRPVAHVKRTPDPTLSGIRSHAKLVALRGAAPKCGPVPDGDCARGIHRHGAPTIWPLRACAEAGQPALQIHGGRAQSGAGAATTQKSWPPRPIRGVEPSSR